MSRSLIIDTDTASDDAVALLLALKHPGVSIRAITVVAGNVDVGLAARNALITLGRVDAAATPVYLGRGGPLLRDLDTAVKVHGEDGMSDIGLAAPSRQAEQQNAVLALIELATSEPDRHELVTIGPLSNIAAALLIEPDLLTLFRHTYIMGGASDNVGNVSPTAEYNVWADPEAAAVVFAAPGAKTMVGWDVIRKYSIMTPADDARLRASGRLGAFASDINAAVMTWGLEFGLGGYSLADPIAMAVALDEGLVTASHEASMMVSTDPMTRGQTFAGWPSDDTFSPMRVVTEVDEGGFKAMLFALLSD